MWCFVVLVVSTVPIYSWPYGVCMYGVDMCQVLSILHSLRGRRNTLRTQSSGHYSTTRETIKGLFFNISVIFY